MVGERAWGAEVRPRPEGRVRHPGTGAPKRWGAGRTGANAGANAPRRTSTWRRTRGPAPPRVCGGAEGKFIDVFQRMGIMETNEITAIQEVLRGRAGTYRMFSRLFLRPLSEEDIDEFAEQRFEEKVADLEGTGLLAEGFNDMGRGLHRRHTGTVKLLNTDFTMCFDGISAYEGLRAVPYASLFAGSKKGDKAELFQEPFRAVRALYRREGVEVNHDLNLPDDHLSFELSFMADMSDAMAAALAAGDTAEALRLADVSEDFRANHLLGWYPALYELALKIVETRFYRGVLKATYGYLELDGDTLAEMKQLLSEAAPAA